MLHTYYPIRSCGFLEAELSPSHTFYSIRCTVRNKFVLLREQILVCSWELNCITRPPTPLALLAYIDVWVAGTMMAVYKASSFSWRATLTSICTYISNMKSCLIVSSVLTVFVQRGVGNPLVARQDDAKSVWDFKEVSPQLGTRVQRLTYHRRSPRVQILFGLHVTKICMCYCVTIVTPAENTNI